MPNQKMVKGGQKMEVIAYQILFGFCILIGWFQGLQKMKISTVNFSKTNNPIKYFLGTDQ